MVRNIGIEEARRRFLGRSPLDMLPFPAPVAQRLEEVFGPGVSPLEAVRRTITEVRDRGDEAVAELSWKLDGVEVPRVEVPPGQVTAARDGIPPALAAAMRLAADRIRTFHERGRPEDFFDPQEGVGRKMVPMDRVGIYVPGGRAAYPSTVLMTAIPARIAGVEEVIVATPPQAGGVAPLVLAACALAGVDRVFAMGGAQAIAALAYGTASVPVVDKVCGPGNLFVMLAKREVFGQVDIDGFYGPTETVVVADDTADPALCAAELLAQAEHDPLASALLLTPSVSVAKGVVRESEAQLEGLERRDIAGQSLEGRGAVIKVDDLSQALDFVNSYAPEHLTLLMADAEGFAAGVRHTGCIFLGGGEAFGDYVAGPSHVLPTGGSARFSSPLGVESFLKVTSVVALNSNIMEATAAAADELARAEGLTAHAAAIQRMLRRKGPR
ncbi:MAG: histidinol dehydrogenase [Dehalococcoidia bacterium]|nr:histidinol dehydrogenase [Dehalococcoidia bacterium]